MSVPVRYARNGDVSLAYQVVGDGPHDLVFTTGWFLPFEAMWDDPACMRTMERLASFCRLILWDKRGTGLSDRVPPSELPTLEERMEDLGAVMEAAGSEQAALFGFSEGGTMSALFAATHPAQVTSLVLCGSFARTTRSDDFDWMWPEEEAERIFVEGLRRTYEEGDPGLLRYWAPSRMDDQRLREWWLRAGRLGASPAGALAWIRMAIQMDIRDVLPAIRVPTLVGQVRDDKIVPRANGRYLAEHIPGARYVEIPGDDHFWWLCDDDQLLLDEVEALLTGAPPAAEPYRVLATVMFTDIVDSTARAAELGDRAWRDLAASHDQTVREQLGRFGGREIKTLGDGFLATFDGPARAIRCAARARDEVAALGLDIRVGLHTGEVELVNGDLGGLAVNIGARVGALAGPGEVLVSSTVKDLVAGSRTPFEDRGEHELKGVPGSWRLYAVP